MDLCPPPISPYPIGLLGIGGTARGTNAACAYEHPHWGLCPSINCFTMNSAVLPTPKNQGGLMKQKIYRMVPLQVQPLGNFRSLPADIGLTVPFVPISAPRHFVHPQDVSQTTGIAIKPLEPRNDSILAIEFPLGLSVGPVGAISPAQ